MLLLVIALACAALSLGGTAANAQAQGTGGIQGRVTEATAGTPIAGVLVSVEGARAAVTNSDGRYRLNGVRVGMQAVSFRRLGYRPYVQTVTVADGAVALLDVAVPSEPLPLAEVVVTGPSRTPERIVEAPAAVVTPDAARVQEMAGPGQVALLVGDLTGVRLAQAGLYDFNLNARGFNSPTNRRLLVLIDGRDISVPILGNQDWGTISVLDDAARVELVRGPGAALYGWNAFNGVLAITTPSVREEVGTRLRLTGGELGTRGGDLRHGWLADDGRWGFRSSVGYQESATFDRSRTNIGDLEAEYGPTGAPASSYVTPAPGYELLPLRGQTKATPFGLPGAASGTPDPVRSYFGAGRVDYYPADGSVVTVEGGSSRIENPVITQSAGRSQLLSATRPWARAAWTSDRFSIWGWYNGREGRAPDLSTGIEGVDRTASLHLEGQGNARFAGNRGRVVYGASVREVRVQTEGTILAVNQDDRRDHLAALYSQVDYAFTPQWRAVAAARLDDGNLDPAQVSPKLGLVYTPTRDHAIRATWNRGLLSPSALQRFIRFGAGPPLDLTLLEDQLRASPLGPSLAGVPSGTLFGNSSAVPVLALGNPTLRPELVQGVELGYKGAFGRWSVTMDAYVSELSQFGTALLPGVNAEFSGWSAPTTVPLEARESLESAVAGIVGNGLTRDRDGSTAFVLSFGNAGTAREQGVEVGVGYAVSGVLRLDANASWYGFHIDQADFQPGDTIQANTPPRTANLALTYGGISGRRMRLGLRWEDAYAFRSGRWNGEMPRALSVDLNAGAPITKDLSWAVSATNLLDQQRFHVMGGSVIGRRVLLTLVWRP